MTLCSLAFLFAANAVRKQELSGIRLSLITPAFFMQWERRVKKFRLYLSDENKMEYGKKRIIKGKSSLLRHQ